MTTDRRRPRPRSRDGDDRVAARRAFLLGAAAAVTVALAAPPSAAAAEGTPPAVAADDLRLRLNPALARVHARDPEAAARMLGELDRILRGPLPRAGTRQVRGPPGLDGLLAENPLLQEAYRIDPKSALTQLREIVRSGGGR